MVEQDQTQDQRDWEQLSDKMVALLGRMDIEVEHRIMRWNSELLLKRYDVYQTECMFGFQQTTVMSRGE
jgi:hypothetical protein